MSDGFDSLDPVDDEQIRATGSAGLPRSYGSYLAASAEEAFETNPASLVIQYAQREWSLRQALADNPMLKPLDVETANAKYGIEGQLKFDAPIYEIRARDMRARRATQLRNQEIFQNPNVGTLGWLGGTAVSFGVGATDPLNIASAFVPFYGQARAAQILGKAYMAGGRLGRTAAYAGMGAVEGFGGAALLEPLNLVLNPELGRDYTAFDSMVNLTFGGLLGAGLHAGNGYFYDRHMGKLMGQFTDSFKKGSGDLVPLAPAPTPPPQPTALRVNSLTPEAQHTTLQTAVGQLVDEDSGPVNVVPILNKIDQATAQRVASHEAKAGDIPLKAIRTDQAITSTGRRVGVTYAIVEADDLRASQTNDLTANPDYPSDLQPRNRSKAASVAQILAIEKDLQPELLGEQPQASDGAPVVTRQGAVLSGNARTIVLKRLAENFSEGNAERWGKYVDWLKSKGYDIAGFKRPVLVRVLTDDLASPDVLAFTRESNVTGVATMSAGETAINDAKNIPDTVLALHQGGDFRLQANRSFLMRLIESIVPTQAERAAMMTADGGLTFDGAKRVERAILARAFNDANLIQVLTENTDDSNIKTIGNSLTDVAPIWAQMRGEASAGTIDPGVDSTNNLLAAVALVRRARDEGRPVTDFIVHGDLLAGDIDPITKAWLAVFYRNDKMTQATGREKLTEFLNAYATEARKQSPEPNLLGDANATPDRIIAALRERERRRTGSQAELFKSQPQNADAAGVPLSPAEHPAANGGPAGAAGPGNAEARLEIGGEPVALHQADPGGATTLKDFVAAIGERKEGETDKQFAKRAIDTQPAPDRSIIPEDPAAYFDVTQPGSWVVNLADVISLKSTEDKGATNGLKRMAAARAGLLGKREPVQVKLRPDGKFEVIDGNGTVNSAKKLGWQKMIVQVLDDAGNPVFPLHEAEPGGATSLQEFVRQIGERKPGETDKQFAKRAIDTLPAPDRSVIPENTPAYFNVWVPGAQVVKLSDVISLKSSEDKGATNGLKRMAAARAGLLGKRDPVQVKLREDGKYEVIDGNGTVNSAKKLGWQNMIVQILDDAGNPVVPPGANKAKIKEVEKQFTDSQAGWTPEMAVAAAERNLEGFKNVLNSVMEEGNRIHGDGSVKVLIGPVKELDRIKEKMRTKNRPDASQIVDVLRSTISVHSPEQAAWLLGRLADLMPVMDAGWWSYKGGYKDRKMYIKMPDGQIGEIIVVSHRMYFVKEFGHALMELSRPIGTVVNAFKKGGAEGALALQDQITKQLDKLDAYRKKRGVSEINGKERAALRVLLDSWFQRMAEGRDLDKLLGEMQSEQRALASRWNAMQYLHHFGPAMKTDGAPWRDTYLSQMSYDGRDGSLPKIFSKADSDISRAPLDASAYSSPSTSSQAPDLNTQAQASLPVSQNTMGSSSQSPNSSLRSDTPASSAASPQNIGADAGKGNKTQGNDESGLPDVAAQNAAIESQILELQRRGIVSDTDKVFAPLEEERLADRRSQALKAAGICLATSIGKAS